MRIVILLILSVCFSGCSTGNEPKPKTKKEMRIQCLEGVVYYMFIDKLDGYRQ